MAEFSAMNSSFKYKIFIFIKNFNVKYNSSFQDSNSL